jgi:hypothetical protein
MSTNEWTAALFSSIDAMDTSRFLSFLTQDGVFRFGNLPAATGHEAIRRAVDGFFSSIHASQHGILNVWSVPDHVICQGYVAYTRHDHSQLTLPFVNVFGMRGKLIHDYLIYIDATPLFAHEA